MFPKFRMISTPYSVGSGSANGALKAELVQGIQCNLRLGFDEVIIFNEIGRTNLHR
jgi:hypothetical protein